MTYTHTYVIMHISESAYAEIKRKLEDAGYQHAIHDSQTEDGTVLDMHGIALAQEPVARKVGKRMKSAK